jgi:hypothetical protein
MADIINPSSGDNGKVQPEQTPNPKPNPEIKLSISFNPERGELQVHAPGNGTMYDEPMSLWLLEKAKAFIFMTNAKANQSRIVTPEVRPRMRDIFRKH